MNEGIIAMTPNIEMEQQLLATGSFRFCDNQTECGLEANPSRPVGVFWRHNNTPTNVVPVGWTHVPGMGDFTECPFCARSTLEAVGEEEYNEFGHDQVEVDNNALGNRAATGATNINRQATPSPNSLKKASTPVKSKSKSKSPPTPADKDLLAHAKKMGMPASALKAMKQQLKQNKREKAARRFMKFSPASYTPTPSPSKSKSNTKKRKRTSPSKSKSKTKKSRK
jgi:hypothetical protein